MKEAIVRLGPRVEIHDVPIPSPGPDEVLINVMVSGTNPKDWKMSEWGRGEYNTGDDIAGIVEKVGSQVAEFHPGDRVAAFHRIRQPYGSYAELAVAPSRTTFHLPKHTSFEEAATIPLAAMTAAVGLFLRLRLPEPYLPAKEPLPLVIYGAASAVGAFAVKLAQKSNIHPLICVAGKGAAFVETLIDKSKGDIIVDYRDGDDAVVNYIQSAIPQSYQLKHAFDCVASGSSYVNCCKVLSREGGTITLVGSVHHDLTYSPDDPDDHEFGFAWFRMFALGLQEGWFSGHPYEIMPGGLGGLQQALSNLKEGKASVMKYVLRIPETEGAGKS